MAVRRHRMEQSFLYLPKQLLFQHGIDCTWRGINRNPIFSGQYPKSLDMIGMLMCHQYRIQILRPAVDRIQSFLHTLSADPGIDQHARPFCAHKNTVSAASAGNTTEIHVLSVLCQFVHMYFPQNHCCCQSLICIRCDIPLRFSDSP